MREYRICRHKETEIHHQDNETGGCKALLAGILWRAIADLTDPTTFQHERREALAWFRNQTYSEFSFLYCCEHLNIPPKKILVEVNQIILSPAFAEARRYPNEWYRKKKEALKTKAETSP